MADFPIPNSNLKQQENETSQSLKCFDSFYIAIQHGSAWMNLNQIDKKTLPCYNDVA